ncbi:COX15/CtaA family protein [Kamptonema cortianum]|uniref:COX15/CtaA family protein n=1 Tax=Geitlerinema calcuttense NRMC-F 0142 TaxID=2922238 RepID=A0ABT7M0Y3_9CYAN|nr:MULTISPECIES: COX15/CtaA family protein [Cyanophyceae]MDK3161787.1 COX15/CtaA family protein [Kamptonema cortianum]MDL5054359.1 COX15/CtaA family protein [Oscillatoria laete-virens NRMC-F 0139]MDL5057918.1 COX15/CtaA family protein [Geitlerinema calcuttense NRMC-F 0142]
MNKQIQPYGLTRRLLHLYALLCVVVTLVLIGIGGVVTSTGSGLAVPDWPTSYGYNMFLFPFSRWFGDRAIFYEHTHRIVASGLGFMMIGLCLWLWLSREKQERPWLCWTGSAALVMVIIQGILGGLRVTELNNFLGLIHGCLAQAFLLLVAAIALFLSKSWIRWGATVATAQFAPVVRNSSARLARFGCWVALVIFVQLMLGAAMRHQHNGLAVPDFPLAYGQVWPSTNVSALEEINLTRQQNNLMPVTIGQIHLHMVHRAMACVVAALVIGYAVKILKAMPGTRFARFAAIALIAGVTAQFALGAWTVLSNKAADIATAHVLGGALLLLLCGLLVIVFYRAAQSEGVMAPANEESSTGLEAVRQNA